jgi:hypothetical protein
MSLQRESIMTGTPVLGQFTACECGSPSIIIPAMVADEAPVSCGGGARVIGSWLGYKTFVSRSIAREAQGMPKASRICVDPILTAGLEEMRPVSAATPVAA